MTRSRLYLFVLIAFAAGSIYLFYHIHTAGEDRFRACLFKGITGYPCPSCGTTRAVVLLSKGEVISSVMTNPFGILLSLMMTVFPVWVLADVISKKDTFFKTYKKAEATISQPWLATFLIVLVLLNWIWNIYKHI